MRILRPFTVLYVSEIHQRKMDFFEDYLNAVPFATSFEFYSERNDLGVPLIYSPFALFDPSDCRGRAFQIQQTCFYFAVPP
mmetsp:Transcript_39665/g.62003  ORF Transcript_39665/g.62003 Transcript_39665/m.62003 type:complete len:81 (-) Transcript_39665:38-280(-)